MKSDFLTAVRKNHALEHATIAVLMSRLGPGVRLMGRAAPDGFYVYGNVTAEAVADAANEGLARLKKGEHSLAVSPLCGTNLVVSGLLAGVASMIAMRGKRGWGSLPEVVLATTLGVLIAQPLGRAAQKHVTTLPDLDDVAIVGITSGKHGRYTRFKIRTEQG